MAELDGGLKADGNTSVEQTRGCMDAYADNRRAKIEIQIYADLRFYVSILLQENHNH